MDRRGPPGARRASLLGRAWPPLLLAALVLAVFAQARGFSFLNFDDDRVVTRNPRVLQGLSPAGVRWAFTTRAEGNWFPLTWLSHQAVAQAFGARPGPHHLANLALHLANALLLFALLADLTGRRARSALAAALFAVHPLVVESVAWVNERKDLLMLFFGLLCARAWLAGLRRPARWRGPLVAALLACGLMAKGLLVTLPVLLLLLDFWPLGRLRGRWPGAARPLLEKAPLFAIAFVFGLVAWAAQRDAGALGPGGPGLAIRLGHVPVALSWYLGKAVWPAGLAVFYPYPPGGDARPAVLGAALLLGAVTAGALALRRRAPHLLAGWLWFVAALLPVSGLVQVGEQAWADRYAYLPLVGLAVAAAWCLPGAGDGRGPRALLPAAAACAAVVALATAARVQAGAWRDDGTLWRRALAVTEGNYVAYNNLGTYLLLRGETEEAGRLFRASLAIRPGAAQGLNNLGLVLEREGRLGEALAAFNEALRSEPDTRVIEGNLCRVLAALGRHGEAAEACRKVLRHDPTDKAARLTLAESLARAAGGGTP